ncbi:MAG: SRPBCC domain-containing protein [Rhizobiaceae bacterium]|nr:SRPBCC domain-containing protein [Rhizobiaceae bacterium]
MSQSARRIDPLPHLHFTRTFDAPKALMWDIWTKPEHMRRWWAPHHFTVPLAEFEARVGAPLRIDFRAPSGHVFANYGEVTEVVPTDRLAFTTEYRENGKLLVVNLFTVTFHDEGRKTRLEIDAKITFAEPEAAESLGGMEQGFGEQLEKLELEAVYAAKDDPKKLAVACPAGSPVILMQRLLDGPRELVWAYMTTKEHFSTWWGPRSYTNEITDFDVREGGKWRVIQRDPKGDEFIFRGVFKEIQKPDRLTWTFGMENMFEGMEAVETYILEDLGNGQTRYSAISVFPSVEARDGMAATDMEWGAGETMDRLDELLAQLKG